MSNTATAAMLVPIATEVVRNLPTTTSKREGKGESSAEFVMKEKDSMDKPLLDDVSIYTRWI
jgi:hypothetical protein